MSATTIIRLIALRIPCIPTILVGYLYWLVFAGWATHRFRFDPMNWTAEAVWRDWVARKPWRFLGCIRWPLGRLHEIDGKPHRTLWKYGTTLGFGIIYHPNAIPEGDTTESDTAHERHEDVHVRQKEDMSWAAFIVAILTGAAAGDFWWFLGIWASAILWMTPAYITAVLRGGHAYRDAEFERAAYAQTDTRPDGSSWIEDHESKKQDW